MVDTNPQTGSFRKSGKNKADGCGWSLMPDSTITNITMLHNTPAGDCDVVSFDLSGHSFMAISAWLVSMILRLMKRSLLW